MKRQLITTLAAVAVLAFGAGSAFADGDWDGYKRAKPVGLWHLDDAYQAELGVLPDLTPDSSCNANDGEFVGNAALLAGVFNNALDVDGNNAHVSVPDNPSLNFGTGYFSIAAWIQTSDDSGVATIIDKRVGENTGYHLYAYNGNLGVQLADGDAINFISTTDVADGKWHHVAATVDRDAVDGIKLYVDGLLVHTDDPTGQSGSLDNAEPLQIGGHSADAIHSFIGASTKRAYGIVP